MPHGRCISASLIHLPWDTSEVGRHGFQFFNPFLAWLAFGSAKLMSLVLRDILVQRREYIELGVF